MIIINGNFDANTYPKIDLGWINDLLKDLASGKLYITLVARADDSKTNARRYQNDVFLWLVLPYAELLAAEDSKTIILNTLIQELHRLEPYQELLEVEALKRDLQKIQGVKVQEFNF